MDSSNSFEYQAFVNANKLEQTETITCMSCDSYNAAAKGNIDFFKAITNQSLDLLRTPNKNTILHIYITSLTFLNSGAESTINFVEEILEMCPSLLRQANAKGETPLHIAARYGHDDLVKVLIKHCAQGLEEGIEPVKKMLRMTNKEKDTALHEAVRYNHLKVVKLLISKDPDFSYSANDAGETPLYIATERKFKDVLFEILDKCKSPMDGGPLGRTALHAAVIQYDNDVVGRILETIDGISRKVDNNGWTPLHLAACNKYSTLIAKELLDKDREVAYMKDTKGRTPLHIAAQRGNVWTMEAIVKRCPDCCELVDNRGWNVLHFALKGGDFWCLERIMKIIEENRSLSNLLNEKNAEGDAPLHFYFKNTSLEPRLLNSFISDPRVDKKAFNKQNLNAREIARTVKQSSEEMMKIVDALGRLPRRVINYKGDITFQSSRVDDYWEKLIEKRNKERNEERRSMLSMLQKATEVHLVVAALIATVTFAACITMPGGFVGGEGSHPGYALLRRSVAFKAFVITDTISMVLSSSAVFIHLLMPFLFDKNINDEKRRMKLVILAFILILGAMVAMGLAFVTGTYAVLVPSSDLAIANCIAGLTFFAIFFTVFGKHFTSSFIRLSSFFELKEID